MTATMNGSAGAPTDVARPAGQQATPGTPAILAAVWAVMKAVRSVGKHGQMNGGGQSYSFRKWDDMSDSLGAAFRDHGVFIQADTLHREYRIDVVEETKTPQNGNPYVKQTRWTTCWIEMQYKLTSLVDGSTLDVKGYGEGRDSSDKATSKAHTMALKYALSEAFLLATKDMTDGDADRPEISTDPAANLRAFVEAKKAVKDMGSQLGWSGDDLNADFEQRYGKPVDKASLADITKYVGVMEFLVQTAKGSPQDTAAAVADIEKGGA